MLENSSSLKISASFTPFPGEIKAMDDQAP